MALVFLCATQILAFSSFLPSGAGLRSRSAAASGLGPGRRAPPLFAAPTAVDESESYVAFDKEGKRLTLTVAEKEQIFLDSLQSFYFDGREVLSNDDFDALKEDLAWAGSNIASLNRNETIFLNAMRSYQQGKPLLSDEEFDALKKQLKAVGSVVAVSTEPRCFLDTGICTVTFTEDSFRKAIIYLPAILIGTVIFEILAFELVEPLRQVNPIITLLFGSPLIWAICQPLTENILFNKPLIARGPCPGCNAPNRIFFGDILGVEGPGENAEFPCKNCAEKLTVNRKTLRVSTQPKKVAA